MRTLAAPPSVAGEPFVDAREAAYTMNLPMYYLTNAKQRTKLRLPHYRIGRLVRFKLSELAIWQGQCDGQVVGEQGPTEEVADD
jgi:hypothetical protein